MIATTAPDALTPKRLATAKARACLAGIQLHDLEGDDGQPMFVVSRWNLTRWNLTRCFSELSEVESWLDFVTGAPK